MHATDIVAYVSDGDILCDDCGAKYDDETPDSPAAPIFADRYEDAIGSTCADCGRIYTPGRSSIYAPEWERPEDARIRWAICSECNHHQPHGIEDRDARLSARRRRLSCPCCARPTLRF